MRIRITSFFSSETKKARGEWSKYLKCGRKTKPNETTTNQEFFLRQALREFIVSRNTLQEMLKVLQRKRMKVRKLGIHKEKKRL